MGNIDSPGFKCGQAWNKWYQARGDAAISTRSGKNEEAFLQSGLEDLNHVLRRLPHPPASERVHEIGCGSGRMTVHLPERFDFVTANDTAKDPLEVCRLRTDGSATVCEGGPETMANLESSSYDFVVSIATLQHIPSSDVVKTYIRETIRILRPEGQAFLEFSGLGIRRRTRDMAVDLGRRIRSIGASDDPPLVGEFWRGWNPPDDVLLELCAQHGRLGQIQNHSLRRALLILPVGTGRTGR